MGKERRSEEELRQMMLAAARQHEECSDLEDLFIFGPTPRRDANWGFGIAGKENKVSVACFNRLDRIASDLQQKYELHPVKAGRRDIEARVWSLVHDRSVAVARRRCLRHRYLQAAERATELDNGMDNRRSVRQGCVRQDRPVRSDANRTRIAVSLWPLQTRPQHRARWNVPPRRSFPA